MPEPLATKPMQVLVDRKLLMSCSYAAKITHILAQITYKDDWMFYLSTPPGMPVKFFSSSEVPLYLGVNFRAICTRTGNNIGITFTGAAIPPDLDVNGILHFALRTLERVEYHELQERFLYQGMMIFDPHKT